MKARPSRTSLCRGGRSLKTAAMAVRHHAECKLINYTKDALSKQHLLSSRHRPSDAFGQPHGGLTLARKASWDSSGEPASPLLGGKRTFRQRFNAPVYDSESRALGLGVATPSAIRCLRFDEPKRHLVDSGQRQGGQTSLQFPRPSRRYHIRIRISRRSVVQALSFAILASSSMRLRQSLD